MRFASIIGVISLGMTFVITAGGIDLSVGSVMGLATVVASLAAVQMTARASEPFGWLLMVVVALAVGAGAGLINGIVVAYGRVVPFMATLAMLVAARGAAELISERRTLIVDVRGFLEFFRGDLVGVPTLIWIFVFVAILAWFLLSRTTFGRRTVALGGNFEASRLAGLKVKRHTVMLYVLAGTAAGIAAVMMMGRTDLRHLDPRHALRARRDRGGRGRRHPSRRRTRHDHRHRLRRADLRDSHERVHAEQPVDLGAGDHEGRHHRHRGAAAAALRGSRVSTDLGRVVSRLAVGWSRRRGVAV